MALDVMVDSLDSVPESIRDEYVERDGKFVLQLNGAYSMADRDALQRSLQAERDAHRQTKDKLRGFGDHTPERLEELTTQNEELRIQLEAAGKPDAEALSKVNELVQARAAALLRPVERKLEEAQGTIAEREKELGEFKGRERRRTIIGSATNAAMLKELGVEADAVEDIELWAMHNFTIEEATGSVISLETVGTPGLSPKEVLADLRASGKRRHWFGVTQGAGAAGGRPNGESFDKNPFSAEHFSLTRIGQVVRQDPQKALRMATQAKRLDLLPKELRPSAD